jgi:putative ubiquitin-RnfH superfamily antitoxin RatB of RatAB toxin-antitoxin module
MTVLVPPGAQANIACAVEGFSLSATIGGTPQVMTATVTAPSVADGDVVVTVTAVGLATGTKDVTVTVKDKDTVEAVAALLAAALEDDDDVGAFFDVGVAGAVVTLTRKTHTAVDNTMALAVKTDASNTGVTITDAITVDGALATSCMITLTPEVTYAAVPVLVGYPQHVKGAGSAATSMSWAITAQAKTGVTITVTLNQAPGAGKTDTIVFNGGLIGVPAR